MITPQTPVLGEASAQALRCVHAHGSLTVAQARELCPEAGAIWSWSSAFKNLRRAGFLRASGPKRGMVYTVTERGRGWIAAQASAPPPKMRTSRRAALLLELQQALMEDAARQADSAPKAEPTAEPPAEPLPDLIEPPYVGVPAGRITHRPTGRYDPRADLCRTARPGAEAYRRYPSRIGGALHYMDGRIEEVPA